MPIKTEIQAAAIQQDYYNRGKIGYAPAVIRYLKNPPGFHLYWDDDTNKPSPYFPFFMPHRVARSQVHDTGKVAHPHYFAPSLNDIPVRRSNA